MSAVRFDPPENSSRRKDSSGVLPIVASPELPPSLSSLINICRSGESISLSGLSGSALACVIAILRHNLGRPVLLVTGGSRDAEEIAIDLETLAGGDIYNFPALETMPGEETHPHPDIVGDRFLFLEKLLHDRKCGKTSRFMAVTSWAALAGRIVRPDAFASHVIAIRPGDRLPMDDLLQKIERGGYTRVEMVEGKGEYCVRGCIVDLFPPAADYPIRIEYLGDAVETIRTFHAQTQRSIEEIGEAVLTPVSELSMLEGSSGDLGTLFDYLPPDILIVLYETESLREALRNVFPVDSQFLSREEIEREMASRQVIYCSLLPGSSPLKQRVTRAALDFKSTEPYRSLGLGTELGERWSGRTFDFIEGMIKDGMGIFIFCNNEGEKKRLIEMLGERGIELKGGSCVVVGRLSGGFIFGEGRIVVLTDAEIFARYSTYKPRRRFKGTASVREFTELKPGDYVVHVGQGIGVYCGLKRIAKEGIEREFMCIEYQEKAKLYVPIEQAYLVERYIGEGKAPPHIDRLGGTRWQGVKIAAQRAIVDYAAELLQLQASRRSQPGHACPPDTQWQREFEGAFVYEETPDQAAAIQEVKLDLESQYPMDRLICGDVGYGKTEVAMRAAFKVVMDGRQVAVLVPTTVLAQQHLHTFTERFADYPVRIEALSRFRTQREQGEVIDGLRSGSVDIVIGTHRLVQPDVSFKNLGLVIVDEEQRFGVKHKEMLKKLRLMVDILTMTATPIPRTLYMSLAGIREMSTISTPPEDRLAIETEVCEYEEDLIRGAIRRELGRQGQVYFVHNYVETIGAVREGIAALAPDAVVAVAHGQMGDEELEAVMGAFVDGRVGVLVCTSIIQSGLDIPNANTIIIDHADRFGLADLYQLKGRVGRYRRRAYAYLLYHRGGAIADDARKRLKAITEHTGLGSGFRIALRDLEIRGAGNILGVEQHGHIAAIGFDLYCKLLKKSIAALKGKEVRTIEGIEVSLPYLAELPSSHIPSETQRIDLYKRMGEISRWDDIEEISSEMRDRFGPPPDETLVLLEVCRLKLSAMRKKILSVSLRDGKLIAVRHGEELRPDGMYPRITAKSPLRAVVEIREKIEKL